MAFCILPTRSENRYGFKRLGLKIGCEKKFFCSEILVRISRTVQYTLIKNFWEYHLGFCAKIIKNGR